MPKQGRALIWPSVRNEDPTRIEQLTHHEALPVEKGVKYGANAWVRIILDSVALEGLLYFSMH